MLVCTVDVCIDGNCAIHEHMVWAWRLPMASGQMTAVNVETTSDACQPLAFSLFAGAQSGEAMGRDTAAAISLAHFVLLTAHPLHASLRNAKQTPHALSAQRSTLNTPTTCFLRAFGPGAVYSSTMHTTVHPTASSHHRIATISAQPLRLLPVLEAPL